MEGRLQTRDWTGQDGIKRYRTEIIADSMIMLDGRPSAGGEQSAAAVEPAPFEAKPQEVMEEEIKVEDIPF